MYYPVLSHELEAIYVYKVLGINSAILLHLYGYHTLSGRTGTALVWHSEATIP